MVTERQKLLIIFNKAVLNQRTKMLYIAASQLLYMVAVFNFFFRLFSLFSPGDLTSNIPPRAEEIPLDSSIVYLGGY